MGRKKVYCMTGPPGRINCSLHNVRLYLKRGYTMLNSSVKAEYEKDLAVWTKNRTGETTSTPEGAVPTAGLFRSTKKAVSDSEASKE